ncbi:MarR family transcriptional regulator [Corallococcus sp. H22C18031201]|uniref:MarR family winged helix-turn-helix transcriptional regulator n=1 Tax=Citreicoccus inhibens TaxID=2849499 RepID=UPI000E72A4E3|nr:MarR family transcriptional regulator [Citreicoccus inhibens]MBU8900879.1 MarR family transcriptional regulator [Citreicoccus inhibens]RJS21755.1 MarR family transcriptional regulator [Corallococcus sp. H22C18031201]
MSKTAEDHVDRLRAQWARELPGLDTQGMEILGRARRITLRVRPAIEAVFEEYALDTGEFDVVSTLLRAGPPYRMRPTELYKSLMISSGGLTDRLTRLTRAGLIRRAEAEGDARSIPVELTPEGRARTEAAFRADMAVEARLLKGLSKNDRTTLATLLRKLAVSLEESARED